MAANDPERMESLFSANGDVNLLDGNGRPPIYYAIIRGQLETVRMLLAHQSIDLGGIRHKLLQWAALSKAYRFTRKREMIDTIASSIKPNSLDIIEAIELTGAVDKNFWCLKDALQLRYSTTPPIRKVLTSLPSTAYGGIREPMTIAEMEMEVQNFPTGILYAYPESRLLYASIFERILGSGDDRVLANLTDRSSFDLTRKLSFFEHAISSSISASNFSFWLINDSKLETFTGVLYSISAEMLTDDISEKIGRIMTTLVHQMLVMVSSDCDCEMLTRYACRILDMFKVCLSAHIREQETRDLIGMPSQLNSRFLNGMTLLHLTMSVYFSKFQLIGQDGFLMEIFPCFSLVEALLNNGHGYIVNTVDDDGNTPLMSLLESVLIQDDIFFFEGPYKFIDELITLLIEHGTHTDACDRKGLTFFDRLQTTKLVANIKRPFSSLQCWSARVIARNRILYHKVLPKTLLEFVTMHDCVKNVLK